MGIQQKLVELKFHLVVGMIETIGGGAGPTVITKGLPLTWDTNNGVMVVYDEDGNPWVYHGTLTSSDLKRGAYVPFSSDGGCGIRKLFPDELRLPIESWKLGE